MKQRIYILIFFCTIVGLLVGCNITDIVHQNLMDAAVEPISDSRVEIPPHNETSTSSLDLDHPNNDGVNSASSQPPEHTNETLSVYFLDVGQGDSTLFKDTNGTTILIDTGRHDRDDVVSYLHDYGVSEIDLLVLTHAHADHIGQTSNVLASFPVREVWMSGDIHSSKTFEKTIDAILHSDADYYEPRAGENFLIGNLEIQVINPLEINGNLHEGCISLRITYGEISFLFTGDAEAQTERAIIERGHEVSSTIFQLGHHGSYTSNNKAFLEQVQPELTIYSAADGNSYGHPHKEVIETLMQLDIPVYGTEYGTILINTDGQEYMMEVLNHE